MVDTTNSVQNSQDNLSDLIKQAEIMQLKLKLEVQFKKNMAFLEKQSPVVYKRFVNHTPTEQAVFIDDNGYVNLINIKSNNPIYNENPEIFAKKQVMQFMHSPTRFITGFKESVIINPKHIHPIITNNALADYQSLNLDSHYDPENPIGFLLMIGCGLGYHIKEIAENYDVRNIFIYDGNKDSFYASLFVIDWEEIVTIFNKKGGIVKLEAGENITHVLTHMRSLPYEIGMHNLIATHAYLHTRSKHNEFFLEQYRKEFHLYGIALGFFDDEQVAFAHTIRNINENPFFFVKDNTKEPESLPPVFIVGNGPSLDHLSELIKQHQNKAIVISCGSALTSLHKIGILPDFHVELERNLTVAKMLEMGTSLDYTKKIPLLGLNNIAQETKKLFKESYLAIKPSDIGSSILEKIMNKDDYMELEVCNPTVSNCGLAYALQLGFTELYLFGTDLGMKDEKNHHSKFSLWHDMDTMKEENPDDHQETLEDYTYNDSRYAIKGNLCDTVLTTNILDSSRKNAELLISYHDGIKIYNPNNGVYIHGAEPISPDTLSERLENLKKIDKQETTEKLLTSKFKKLDLPKIDKDYIEKNYTALYFKIHEAIELPETCDNLKDIYEHLCRIYKNLKSLEAVDKTTSMLVMGSIQVHFSLIYYYCLKAKTSEEITKCYKIGKKHYDQLIAEATDIIKNDILRKDDTGLLK